MIPAYLSDFRLSEHQSHWSPQKRPRAGVSSNYQLLWPQALRPRLGFPFHDHPSWSCEPPRVPEAQIHSAYKTLSELSKE